MAVVAGLTWRTHLFARRRWRGVVALAVVLATLVSVQILSRTPLLTTLAAAVFLVTLWPFYFPVRYALDEVGVQADYGLWRRHWSWTRFRAFVALPDAVMLTPFVRPHRLDRFRAVLLPCPDNARQVVAHVAEHLAPRVVLVAEETRA